MFLFPFLNTAVCRSTDLLFILHQENPSVHGLFKKNIFKFLQKILFPGSLCCPGISSPGIPAPAFPHRLPLSKVPVRTRFHSDKYAAVLRL
ncbi:hypothetical protein BEI59_27590 [Eisenbergiella tayi]|uniref:Uncharacterized protein n=1 Tax=Eisenbergiella tayi TaxID=1432052 RepID=A0A1E3UBR3_9FIRM|nr:hypothetical protein BEI59_27590 [Eisenbergiella tayi]